MQWGGNRFCGSWLLYITIVAKSNGAHKMFGTIWYMTVCVRL